MVAAYIPPDSTTQAWANWRSGIDGAIVAGARVSVAFLPQAQASPNMTVRVLAGALLNGTTLTEVAAQNTGTIVAPTTNPRIDRVVLNPTTGALQVVTGTEAVSPVAPAIPADRLPLCRFQLATGATSITNAMIVDERVPTGSAQPSPLPISAGGTGATSAAGARAALGLPDSAGYPADGRLTLTTGVPVTTGDVTAASTLFYTPYVGNRIALFDGTNWSVRTFTERSLALSGLTANRPHDVFIWDNAGTLALELTAWTSDTARATALVRQDGVWVRSGAATRRYLGTIYTTGATTTEDSEANRFVSNAYNRVSKQQQRVDTTASWTYTLSAWRQANGSAANQYRFVTGLAEEMAEAAVTVYAINTGGNSVNVGVGVNSTTVNSAQIRRGIANSSSGGNPTAHWRGVPAIGLTTIAWLEASTAAGTTTWRGGDFGGDLGQSGIIGSVRV